MSILAVAVAVFGLWVVWRQVQLPQAGSPPPASTEPATPPPDAIAADAEMPGAAPPAVDTAVPDRMDRPPRAANRSTLPPAGQPTPSRPAMPEPPAVPLPAIDAELSAAFSAMVEQDFAAAEESLSAAEAKAGQSPARDRVAAWQELLTYARGYSSLERQALDDVASGNEYDTASGKIAVIESTPERLSFLYKGTTQRVVRDKIPRQIVDAILADWLDDRPANLLYVGAHAFTSNPPDTAAARQAWDEAAAGGANASGLLSLLDDPAAD